jgi:chromate transporter
MTASPGARTPFVETVAARPRVSLAAILIAFLQLGLTAFGVAILGKLRALVISRGWLTEEDTNDGLALVQLYPGPIMVDFTAYAGYRVRGVPGAIASTTGFILPSFVLMVGLSAAYFALGDLPWVAALLLGLEALVVGVLLNVVLDLGSRSVTGRMAAAIALLAFVALLYSASAILIVLAALVVGALLIRPTQGAPRTDGAARASLPPAEAVGRRRWAAIAAVGVAVLAVASLAWALSSPVGDLGLSMFKIGAVAFGNGATIMPLLQAEAVDAHQWLTMRQFADGIALGQVTPGPFLITAAFVGFKVGGIAGAALATFGIFSPSFAMTLIFTEVFGRVRDLRVVRGALAGVLASFVGLLAAVTLQLGKVALTTPAALAFGAAAFVAVRFFKLDLLWVFGGGLLVWGALLLAIGAV